MDPVVIAAVIGAIGTVCAPLAPQLLKGLPPKQREKLGSIGLVSFVAGVLLVMASLLVVRLIGRSEYGWAMGFFGVAAFATMSLVVGSLGVLSADEQEGGERKLQNKAIDSDKK